MSLTGKANGSTMRGAINLLRAAKGYSAYELAVINGFSGTEEEWLASLTATDEQVDEAVAKYIAMNGALSPAQYEALLNLLKLAVFKEDPTEAWAAFQNAFVRPVPATAISLSATIATFGYNSITESASGHTKQLTATVTPANTTDEVVWESSDESVATVEDGLVTTVGDGECYITATAGYVSASCLVTVEPSTSLIT